ncbi:MAG: MaoC family dehydratase N-terminal domain-containing protein [Chloroflexi bacterium]|nr:MaoC family dehydratase N-terminal domain-containing protein [Chloroflexota bacterium]
MATEQQLDFDRSQLGVEYPAGAFQVRKEDILRYCKAIAERAPVHTDEEAARAAGHPSLLAPPTFCAMFVRAMGRPDIRLTFGRTSFHAGEALEAHAPIYAGDTLSAATRLKEVYAKTGRSGTMAFIVWETSFTNQHGELVASVQESFVRRD